MLCSYLMMSAKLFMINVKIVEVVLRIRTEVVAVHVGVTKIVQENVSLNPSFMGNC